MDEGKAPEVGRPTILAPVISREEGTEVEGVVACKNERSVQVLHGGDEGTRGSLHIAVEDERAGLLGHQRHVFRRDALGRAVLIHGVGGQLQNGGGVGESDVGQVVLGVDGPGELQAHGAARRDGDGILGEPRGLNDRDGGFQREVAGEQEGRRGEIMVVLQAGQGEGDAAGALRAVAQRERRREHLAGLDDGLFRGDGGADDEGRESQAAVHAQRAALAREGHDDDVVGGVLRALRLFLKEGPESVLHAVGDGENVTGDVGGAGEAEVGGAVDGVEVADGGADLGVVEAEGVILVGLKGDAGRVFVSAQGGGVGDAVRADKGDGLGGVGQRELGLVTVLKRDGDEGRGVRAGDGDGDCGDRDGGRDEGHGAPLRHRLAGRPAGGIQANGLVEGLVVQGEGEARGLGGRPHGQLARAVQRGVAEIVVLRRGLGEKGRRGQRRHRPEKVPVAHVILQRSRPWRTARD